MIRGTPAGLTGLTRTLGFVSLALCFDAAPAATFYGASADFVDRGTAQAPQSDIFSIANVSDVGSGIRILAVTIDLTAADTNLEDLFPSDSPHVPVFDTVDGCSGGYCYGEEIGYPIVAESGGVETGFVALTGAGQAALEQSQALTLQFNEFDPGELFTFTTDLDDLFDFRISGREFAFSVLSVTFAGGALPAPVVLSGEYAAADDGFFRAVAEVGAEVPLPAAFWMLLGGIGVLGAGPARRTRGLPAR